ncbi:MAG TPA: polyprenol monophosphomannose synthase [bacterium]|nr:polyprenol monophosphomannose synthase [bacterium]
MKQVVVIPTYNEAENMPVILPRIREIMPELRILVVDDNSPDGTADLVEKLNETLGGIEVMRRAGKQGLGTAYIDAFLRLLDRGYEAIGQMDADLSHDPSYLPQMFGAMAETDIAIGSRYVAGGGTKNWGLSRKIISRGGGLYARTILGLKVNDLTSGFRVWRAEVLRAMDLPTVGCKGFGFQIEITYRAIRQGYRFKEIPIIFPNRTAGQPKMSGGIFWEALINVWKIRAYRPPQRHEAR